MANNAVTRADLADALCQNLGLARSECYQLLEDVLNEISDCLARDEPVKLAGFGSFLVRHKKERMARNPKTGERVEVPAKRIPYFKPGKELKELINADHTESAPSPAAQPQTPAGGQSPPEDDISL